MDFKQKGWRFFETPAFFILLSAVF